jgi:hypothetical protein
LGRDFGLQNSDWNEPAAAKSLCRNITARTPTFTPTPARH